MSVIDLLKSQKESEPLNIKPALESECAILGALLLDSTLFEKVKYKLCAVDFFYPKHQKIYEAMAILDKAHGTFDIPMLLDELDYSNIVDADCLYNLANNCCSTKNLLSHADIVLEKSVQRGLLDAKDQIF